MKAILLDPDRGIVASRSYDVALYSYPPGWTEADTEEWWWGVTTLFPRLLSDVGATGADVAALAVSGMVPAVVLLDEQDRPLRRAILQNDARASREIDEIRSALGEFDLLALTGSVLSQQSVAPTASWLNFHEPEVWKQVASIRGSYDWLAHALGARDHVEENWAIEGGLYDFDSAAHRRRPGRRQRALARVLLEVCAPGTVVGEVSRSAAAATGLASGTAIVVGGADHVLSAYGAGLVREGECLIKIGGAGDILAVSDRMVLDRRLYLDRHPVPGKWLPNGCMATSGSLLRWEQSLFDGAPLEELDAAAAQSAPGNLLVLPYFLGEKTPLHDPDLRGVMVGMNLATTRGDIHRSFLEAIAYGFRSHVEIFAEDGLHLTRTTVTNGGSKSRLWREILADVLNRDLVSITDHPGAAFGAAVHRGHWHRGRIEDWSYVTGALDEGDVISPNPANIELYDQRYQEFLRLSDVTTSISHDIARSTS